MQRFSDETDSVLRASGWQPGRAVDTEAWRRLFEGVGLPMHDAAKRFLSEFGGLAVSVSGPGVSRARVPFTLDPALAGGEDDRFAEWGEEIGSALFPIGELDHGRFVLGISESDEIYLVSDWLASYGPGQEALERLIRGIAPDIIEE